MHQLVQKEIVYFNIKTYILFYFFTQSLFQNSHIKLFILHKFTWIDINDSSTNNFMRETGDYTQKKYLDI